MRDAARAAYSWLAALFVAGVVVQFFLAGLGVFRTQHEADGSGANVTKAAFDHSFGPHMVLGNVLVLVSFVLLIVAVVARPGRRVLLATVAVLLLVLIQEVFANRGPPAVRALHPLLGLGILGAAGYAVCLAGLPWLGWRRRGDG